MTTQETWHFYGVVFHQLATGHVLVVNDRQLPTASTHVIRLCFVTGSTSRSVLRQPCVCPSAHQSIIKQWRPLLLSAAPCSHLHQCPPTTDSPPDLYLGQWFTCMICVHLWSWFFWSMPGQGACGTPPASIALCSRLHQHESHHCRVARHSQIGN